MTGHTLAENLEQLPDLTPGQDVVMPLSKYSNNCFCHNACHNTCHNCFFCHNACLYLPNAVFTRASKYILQEQKHAPLFDGFVR